MEPAAALSSDVWAIFLLGCFQVGGQDMNSTECVPTCFRQYDTRCNITWNFMIAYVNDSNYYDHPLQSVDNRLFQHTDQQQLNSLDHTSDPRGRWLNNKNPGHIICSSPVLFAETTTCLSDTNDQK